MECLQCENHTVSHAEQPPANHRRGCELQKLGVKKAAFCAKKIIIQLLIKTLLVLWYLGNLICPLKALVGTLFLTDSQ